jgi:hypothetical protein
MGAAARSDSERFGEAARGFEDLIGDAAAMVGARSRAHRDRTSAGHLRCRAAGRIRVRRNTFTEAFQTGDAGRAGVQLPSEALHRT